jgi:hypothetical protein
LQFINSLQERFSDEAKIRSLVAKGFPLPHQGGGSIALMMTGVTIADPQACAIALLDRI